MKFNTNHVCWKEKEEKEKRRLLKLHSCKTSARDKLSAQSTSSFLRIWEFFSTMKLWNNWKNNLNNLNNWKTPVCLKIHVFLFSKSCICFCLLYWYGAYADGFEAGQVVAHYLKHLISNSEASHIQELQFKEINIVPNLWETHTALHWHLKPGWDISHIVIQVTELSSSILSQSL